MRIFLTSLVLSTAIFAGTYDDTYKVTQLDVEAKPNFNLFMQGDFEEIIRYEMIPMKDEDFNVSKVVENVANKIDQLQNEEKVVQVSIIGHTNEATDDKNEKSVRSQSYGSGVEDLFSYSLDTNESQKLSLDYAKQVEKMFLDKNISKDILFVESRGGLDLGFSDETDEGKDLSNRVMIALYVTKLPEKDSDGDGIFDKQDRCQNTPQGVKVDNFGCPLDSDGDGVIDIEDECPKTPQGVSVDAKGCPLDSDGDGIVDYKDECPNTISGLEVDPKGCALKKNLHVNFKTSSDRILKGSYSKVKEFSEFLKKNPTYKANIIGHTDSRGKAAVNMDLSQRRANSVMKALIKEGIEPSRLRATGKGELEPIATNRTEEGRRINRRTEVELFY